MHYTGRQKSMLMKTNKYIILAVLFFCRCTDNHTVEKGRLTVTPDNCFPTVSDTYVYPVTPGMEEWIKSDDNFAFVQLPDKVLKSISTPGLIDALVNSPLFTGFYLLSSSSSPVDTWHRHYERFNCANELFKREDAGDVLVDYYRLVCFNCFNSSGENKNIRQADMHERISGLEYLFTRQDILDRLSHRQKQETVKELLLKFAQNPEKPSNWTRFIPMARIMLEDQYAPIVELCRDDAVFKQRIIWGDTHFSKQQEELIISLAKDFINQ